MLFNSYEFLFVYLPVTLVLFHLLLRFSYRAATLSLLVMSVVFYGYWKPQDTTLLLGSIAFNLAVGKGLVATLRQPTVMRRALLIVGVSGDLAVLAFYKYADFLAGSFYGVLGLQWTAAPPSLPLGLSFYTFTQIAFLVDLYRQDIRDVNALQYPLFVSYFPHLIAGPIIHYKNVVPQFAAWAARNIKLESALAGLTIFAIGLVKKVLLADSIEPYVALGFDTSIVGAHITFLESWGAALCFGLQLYFDFSAYSDMAIGLSLMFGVTLPINFNSPYKAINIIDFWRRWHMTLSAFLRDYLYIPLGGNRRGIGRHYVNIMITMLLGGLWHGAAWTFVAWGGLHGAFLVVNHAWRELRRRAGHDLERSRWWGRLSAQLLTFCCVIAAWALFRAPDFATARELLSAMAGFNGLMLPDTMSAAASVVGIQTGPLPFVASGELYWIAGLLGVAWFLPNTNQLVPVGEGSRAMPRLFSWLQWKAGLQYGVVTGVLLAVAITRFSNAKFLYFNF